MPRSISLNVKSPEVKDSSFCILCLKPAVRKYESKRRKQSVKYLYTVCCKVLKINVEDPVFHLRKKVSFCMSCLFILKECDSLITKLDQIQMALMKIEIDMKNTISKSQKTVASALKSDETSCDYQHFRSLAIQDFKQEIIPIDLNPTVSNNTNKPSSSKTDEVNNLSKRKETAVDDAVSENDASFNEISIKEECLGDSDDQNNSLSPFNDLDFVDDYQNESDIDNEDPLSTEAGSDTDVSLCENQKTKSDTKYLDLKENSDAETYTKAQKRKEENEDPEFTNSDNGKSDSDEDFNPKSTKKRKSISKSKPWGKKPERKRCKAEPPKKCKRKPRVRVPGEPRIKRPGTGRPKGRINQLNGIEFAVGEKRWSYRSIEYFYNEEHKSYECTLCGNRKTLQNRIRGHIGTFHGVDGYGKWHYKGIKYSFDKERNRFVCSVCSKDFSTRNTLGRHINFAHIIELENGQRLNQSGKEYKQVIMKDPPVELGTGKWKYKTIEFTKDESTGHYTCAQCLRVRKSWHSIILHIRESHNDDKSKLENQCQECGQTFGTSYRLKAHLLTHSEAKAFQCDECGEIFRHRGSLYAHVGRIHKGRRPYVCEYCSKSFFTRKDCNVHVRTHTKEKPYICEYEGCGIAFSLRATLKNHQKSRCHSATPTIVLTPL